MAGSLCIFFAYESCCGINKHGHKCLQDKTKSRPEVSSIRPAHYPISIFRFRLMMWWLLFQTHEDSDCVTVLKLTSLRSEMLLYIIIASNKTSCMKACNVRRYGRARILCLYSINVTSLSGIIFPCERKDRC